MRAYTFCKALTGCLTLALLTTVGVAATAKPFLIATDGTAHCRIEVNAAAEAKRQVAAAAGLYNTDPIWVRTIPPEAGRYTPAELLVRAVQQMCGVTLAITNTPLSQGPAITLGTAADFPELARRYRLDTIAPDGYLLFSSRQRLLVLAPTEVGLDHAVFRLLHHLGWRWLAPNPDWIITPQYNRVAVTLNERREPAFKSRRFFWTSRPSDAEGYARLWMRGNGVLFSNFRVHNVHSWQSFPRQLFASHPEYFALQDGKRVEPKDANFKLCVSNPDVQQIYTTNRLAILARHPTVNMVSVEPSDGTGYCQCDQCAAIGSPTDQVVFLANVVARAVRTNFPGKQVGLLAYAGHSEPPRQVRLEPEIHLEFTTGFRWTPLTQEAQVAAWRQQGARDVGVYDYLISQWAGFRMPGACNVAAYYHYAHDIRRWRDLGFSAFTGEADSSWLANGPGMWLTAQWLWDPDIPVETLISDYCSQAFGRAAVPMRRLYDRWALGGNQPAPAAIAAVKPWDQGERLGMANRYGGAMTTLARRFGPRDLKLALLDLEAAYALESDPAPQRRLDHVAIYLHSLRLLLDFRAVGRSGGKETIVGSTLEEALTAYEAFGRYATHLQEIELSKIPGYFAFDDLKRGGPPQFADYFNAARHREWQQEARKAGLPAHAEIRADIRADLNHYAAVPAIELGERSFSGRLLPAAEALPQQVAAWRTLPENNLPRIEENEEQIFSAQRGETLEFTYQRLNTAWGWSLSHYEGSLAATGQVAQASNSFPVARIEIPADGTYCFRTGTEWPRGCVVRLQPTRPHVWRGGCIFGSLQTPLYFHVPAGTHAFGIQYRGYGVNRLILKTATGDEHLVAGRVFPDDTFLVEVPPGMDNQIWSLACTGARASIIMRDIPSLFAASPAELLVYEEALTPPR